MAKKMDYFDLKVRFNDVVMRELGLDITEDDYLYDMDSMSIIQIKEKYIKYSEHEYTMFRHNEIEMNLIENPRLMENIALPFLVNFCGREGYIFHSMAQVPLEGSKKGYFTLSYVDIATGECKEVKSDVFMNESVRILNFITKINMTSHLYDFNEFDVEIPKKR